MIVSYSFQGELWLYDGDASWHFITVPKKISDEIKSMAPQVRGFGSIRIKAKIDDCTWSTSIFPDSKSDSYLLPVKKKVRELVNIKSGDKVPISIEIKDL